MMILPFQPDHLTALSLQDAQSHLWGVVPADYGFWLRAQGNAYTFLIADRPVACCGLVQEWEGRAFAWALLSPAVRPVMGRLTRLVDRYFTMSPVRRIEAQVPEGFEQGHRWARLLRFENEGPMKHYLPDGGTAYRYARYQPCPP